MCTQTNPIRLLGLALCFVAPASLAQNQSPATIKFVAPGKLTPTQSLAANKNTRPSDDNPVIETIPKAPPMTSAVSVKPEAYPKGTVLYVHFPKGLNLRRIPNLHAKTLIRMAYGDKVTVIRTPDSLRIIRYDNINSLWINIRYKNLEGYAFGGYLSRFPTPQSNSLKTYQHTLTQVGIPILASTAKTDNASKASESKQMHQLVELNNATFIDGYLIARRLFKLPKWFRLPTYAGRKITRIKDPAQAHEDGNQVIEIQRDPKGRIVKMTYYEKGPNWGRHSTITVKDTNKIRLQVVQNQRKNKS